MEHSRQRWLAAVLFHVHHAQKTTPASYQHYACREQSSLILTDNETGIHVHVPVPSSYPGGTTGGGEGHDSPALPPNRISNFAVNCKVQADWERQQDGLMCSYCSLFRRWKAETLVKCSKFLCSLPCPAMFNSLARTQRTSIAMLSPEPSEYQQALKRDGK